MSPSARDPSHAVGPGPMAMPSGWKPSGSSMRAGNVPSGGALTAPAGCAPETRERPRTATALAVSRRDMVTSEQVWVIDGSRVRQAGRRVGDRYCVAPHPAEAHTPPVQNPHPTRYAELNGVLHDLVTGAQAALGESFVGAYVQGSFALGAGDLHSDCDFLVVVRERPGAEQEAALRGLHRELSHREGFWNTHLEGSYAVAADLRTTDGLDREWLYVDHGNDEMEWSTHCNQPWARWILREHGITLVGPCPVELVDPVPDDVLRERARAGLATL